MNTCIKSLCFFLFSLHSAFCLSSELPTTEKKHLMLSSLNAEQAIKKSALTLPKQDNDELLKEKLWLTVGVEPILVSDAAAQNSTLTPHVSLSVRTPGLNEEEDHSHSFIGLLEAPEYTSDVGILCGLFFNSDYALFSASGGLAYVEGDKEEDDLNSYKDYYKTMGIPLEIQAFWKPSETLGLGIVGFANINSMHSYTGAALALRFAF